MKQDRSAEDPRTSRTGAEQTEFHVLEPDGLASFASESTAVTTLVAAEGPGDLLLQFPEEVRRPSREIHVPPPTGNTAARPMAAVGVAFLIVAAAAGGWWAARQRPTIVPAPAALAAPEQIAVSQDRQAERPRAEPAPETVTLQPERGAAQIEPAPTAAPPPEALAAVSSRTENTPIVAAATPSIVAPPRPGPESRRLGERLGPTQLGTSGAESKPLASPVTQAPARVVEQPVIPRAPEATLAAAVLPAAAPPAQPLPSPPQTAPSAPAPSQPQAFATAAVRTEQSEIQQALGQYRTAYQRLDAQAARTVWPSVDVRALGRAFSTLSSQQLAFDSCLFDITGDNATAHCTGSATYTPKVGGGGSRSELRQWTFQLRKAPDGWKIQSAQIRRDD